MSYDYNYRTVTTSPWLALQKIKKSYRDLSDEQLKLLDQLLSDADDAFSDAIDRTVIGASNRAYRFVKNASSNDLTIKFLNLTSSGSYTTEYSETIANYFTNGGMQDIDKLLAGGLTLSSIISDISDGQSFNTLIANITNAFQSAQSLTYSDISSICQETGNAAKDDKNQLMNYLRQLLNNGKINSYSWMALIRNLLSKTNDQVSSNVLYLDTSQPFIIRSMVSYIFTSLVPLIISGICLLLSRVFGAIIFIIYTVLKSVIDIFKSAYNNTTEITVNDQASTDYVDGPVEFSVTNYNSNMQGEYIFAGLQFEDGFAFSPIGPYHTFSWRVGDQPSDQFASNVFLSMGWRWDKALETMANWQYRSNYSYGNYLSYVAAPDTSYNVLYTDEQYYMSPEEIKIIASDPKALAIWLFMSVRVAKLINQHVPIDGNFFVVNSDGYGSNTNDAYHDSTHVLSLDNYFYRYVLSWFKHQENWPGSTAWTDNYTAFYQIVDALNNEGAPMTIYNNILTGLQNFYTNDLAAWIDKAEWNNGNTVTLHQGLWIKGDDSYAYKYASYAHPYKYPTLMLDWGSFNGDFMRSPVESVPPDRYLTIPSTTTERVKNAIAVVSAITTAVIATAMIAKRAVSSRAIKKKTLRANELLETRDIYSRYPESELMQKQYTKEVKRYNLKAKVFGWQTFDPTNGWFDSPSDASVSVATASLFGTDGGIIQGVSNSTISAVNAATALGLTDLGNSTTTQFNQSDLKLQQIKHLIDGSSITISESK